MQLFIDSPHSHYIFFFWGGDIFSESGMANAQIWEGYIVPLYGLHIEGSQFRIIASHMCNIWTTRIWGFFTFLSMLHGTIQNGGSQPICFNSPWASGEARRHWRMCLGSTNPTLLAHIIRWLGSATDIERKALINIRGLFPQVSQTFSKDANLQIQPQMGNSMCDFLYFSNLRNSNTDKNSKVHC